MNVPTSSDHPTHTMTTPVYRFKFSPAFQELLARFSSGHRYDEPSDFRQAFDAWNLCHKDTLEQEGVRLNALGYKGDLAKKAYRSARYYFKEKSLEKKGPQKRKPYVPVPGKLLDVMDSHIKGVALPGNLRPSYAYNNFISDGRHMMLLGQVDTILEDAGLDGVATEAKVKKTYKNRYFLQQAKSRGDKDKTL